MRDFTWSINELNETIEQIANNGLTSRIEDEDMQVEMKE